jgi:hypothetical protein
MPRVYNKRNRDAPKDAVCVDRSSVYGNKFVIGRDGTREEVIQKHKTYINEHPELKALIRRELKDKDLVCWCYPLPCHADTLLEIANSTEE